VISIDAFMAQLRERDISLSIDGDELRCRARKGTLTRELTSELSARKADILQYLRRAEALTTTGGGLTERAPRDQPLLPSFGQQRLWFLDRLEGPSATYTMPMAVRLDGALDTRALERALLEIIRRHEVLRSNFVMRGREPIVEIHEAPDHCLTLDTLDAALLHDPAEEAEAIQRLVQREAQRCFDLAAEPLLHASVVRLNGTSHLFLVSMHHIICDGWSLDVFLRELTSLYDAFSRGLPSSLAALPLQYVDFAHWQRQQLQGEPLAAQTAFWRGQLAGVPDLLALPTDRPRPPVQTYRGASLHSMVDAELTAHLRSLGQTTGATLFMTLLAGFAILLSRYSNQSDIVVGTPSANRTHPDLEGLIGLFINTLVIRCDLSGAPSVRDFVQCVRETCLQAYDHQDLPFEQLVQELQPARTLSYPPLVQVTFDLRTPAEKVEMPGLALRPVEPRATAAKFDLSLSLEDTGSELAALWTYNPDLFDAATVARMAGHYRVLLEGMAARPDKGVRRLPLMDMRERQEMVDACGSAGGPQPRETTILDLFEACVRRAPDRTAVTFADQTLTYRQLHRQTRRLAGHLQGLGIGPESRVALCVERSLDMVIGLLGILEAGGSYIPLDPAFPRERLAQVFDDAAPAIILTQQHLRSALPPTTARVICLDGGWDDGLPQGAGAVHSHIRPDNAAYVIYTSGSTGRPKGVQVSHRALLNLLLSMQREPGFGEHDALLAVTTVSFDIAALELFLPLVTGGRLVMAQRETGLDGRALQAALRNHGITCMQATPATWRMLVDTDWDPEPGFAALCGGEALAVPLSGALRNKNVQLWNLYGPTETTIWSAVRPVSAPAAAGSAGADRVEPIGHPVDRTRLCVMDAHGQLLPVGIAGELCIGGAGLARGYLHQAGLTADKYVPDPFDEAPGARLYRTGDLVRRLPDGLIEFLGRIDHQVKIRGFRIELGEIEAALRRHPGVKEAVAMAREDVPGDKRLVAYLVATHDPPPEPAALRSALRAFVPEYMLPAAFVVLPAMPLTPNGKIDRRALPPPGGNRLHKAALESPRSELERDIATVWQQLLRVDHIGIDDNFFDLGGHSLLLTQVHEALRGRTAKPFPLVTLFQYPTVRTLAAWLAQEEATGAIPNRTAVSHRHGATTEIAIIGLAGRFPGADDLETFWANLRDGRESIRFFSDEEMLAAGVEPELVARPNYVRANGRLSDITGFDAPFFGLTPAEAEVIDPQHRLFLETVWHTLEHAGYAAANQSARIGVFAGCSYNGYLLRHLLPNMFGTRPLDVQQVILGSEKDFLCTRVSYALDLRGPSVNVQTACSTSLVAVHLACKSLLDGECDMALAGAVGLKIPQTSGYTYNEGMIHSPDGHCRAFDADAQGTTWGSGVGVVLLKRLDAARSDRDTIHAVIKGSAVNNDGSLKVSFTAPGLDAQAAVIGDAQARAGVTPDSISYVEAHGTGTRLGDPIEVAALTRAFDAGTDKRQFCALGSVKPNIGHLDTAAGVAGLIKTVLALQHRQVPPTVHFTRANPEIEFQDSPFYVNDRLRDWPAGASPRRAGVSSFGIGGTNAHLIVEEAPARAPSHSARPWQLLVLSARTETATDSMRDDLAEHLGGRPDVELNDVAYSLAVGRRALAQRVAVVCRDTADAATALRAKDRVRVGRIARTQAEQGVIFMFPGQGSQFAGMGMGLYRTEPMFREHIDRCAELLRDELGLDLRRVLYPPPQDREAADAQLSQTWLTQPALFATEYALARLWMSWGVIPRAMIGHSLGEYVAACLAGIFDLETALHVVARRSRLMWEQPQGTMLAVGCGADKVAPLLSGDLSLAAVNTPDDCVVSGPGAAVEGLAARLQAADIPCRLLQTSHAFHSAMMQPMIGPFTDVLRDARLRPAQLPFVSNLTGDWIRPDEAAEPEYWVRHVRDTVSFASGLDALLQEPNHTLLEVGPGATLTSFARRHRLAASERGIVAGLRRPGSGEPIPGDEETRAILDSLGRLWTSGVDIDWTAYYAHDQASRIPLPCYPFERRRCWIDPPPRGTFSPRPSPDSKQPLDQWFFLPGWKPTLVPPAADLQAAADPSLSWLVFSDASELCRRTIDELTQTGQKVITVTKGDCRERHDDRHFRIRPLVPDDYEFVIDAAGDQPAQKVLHFWSLSDSRRHGMDHFETAQETGYYSLLFLGRALAKQPRSPEAEITVVTNHLHDADGVGEVCPEKSTLLGPCLVMPQEAPQLSCRCLDVVLPSENGASAAARLAKMIIAEAVAASGEPLVAYRGNRRLVPSFERVFLDASAGAVRRLRDRGVYLITGGLGKVGLLLARHLAETVQARLVLLGRSGFPPRAQWDRLLQSHPENTEQTRRIRQLQEIEALGAEVLLVEADVADERHMRAALDQVHDRWGVLHGVIHAAGRLDDPSYVTMFTEAGQREAETQFTPKIRGLYVLEAVLRGLDLDFCLAISSNSAVLGGFGFAAYGAANAFIDAFVTRQNQLGDNRWMSANWDTWLFDTPSGKSSGPALAMTPSESVEAFRRVVSCIPEGRVVVSTGDLQARFDRWVRREGEQQPQPRQPSAAAAHSRPEVSASFVTATTDVETRLAALWQELLGFTSIGIHDDFFELGGNSLLAIRLMTMIKDQFGKQCPLAVLLAKPTIQQLAEVLGQATAFSFSPLVAVQPKGSLAPFFCVPGTGGNVLYLRELANCLGAYGRPLYAFQASGLDGKTPPLTRIEDIAAQNIHALREAQGAGPYLLGGHSFGSWVAFEMARQLRAAGDTVGLLTVLDAGAPAVRDFSAMGGWDDTKWLLTIADMLSRMYGKPHALRYEELVHQSWMAQIRALTRALETVGAVQRDTDAEEIRGFVEVYRTQAQIRYDPPPGPPLKIALFKAREPLDDFLRGMPEAFRRDEMWGWRPYDEGRLAVEYVPGHHLSMMAHPHVQHLAERLQAVLLAHE
jgi:amino acid adenylation domain-containing protein